MIALLLAARAFAQDPEPAEPVPADPVPADPVPEEPPIEAPAPEPEWEPVTIGAPEPDPVPVEAAVPAPVPESPEQPEWVRAAQAERGNVLRFGIGVEIGSLANTDPAYDLFSTGDGMGSGGVAVGFHALRNLAIVGSWHHFRHGAELTAGIEDTDADFESEVQVLRSAWFGNEGTLGLRLDAGYRDVLFPYATGQGVLLAGKMRLDDDPSTRDNPGQVQASALSWGWMATGGVEIRFPPQADVQFAISLELGYAWLDRADFGDFGTMQPGGFASRSGVGLRF